MPGPGADDTLTPACTGHTWPLCKSRHQVIQCHEPVIHVNNGSHDAGHQRVGTSARRAGAVGRLQQVLPPAACNPANRARPAGRGRGSHSLPPSCPCSCVVSTTMAGTRRDTIQPCARNRTSSPASQDAMSPDMLDDPEATVNAVLSLLNTRISPGEINDVRNSMRKSVRDMWPEPPLTPSPGQGLPDDTSPSADCQRDHFPGRCPRRLVCRQRHCQRR
jgi:hypothetical protein